jgi:hypothetical protein
MKSAEHIWNELRVQPERPVFRRVDEIHQSDLYLGIDTKEAPVLMLLSPKAVERLPHLRALEITQNIRHDGRFALLITLRNADLFHLFQYVCNDLIESSRGLTNLGQESMFVVHRLEKWRRLLEGGGRGLSRSELMGLVGELLFLKRLIRAVGCSAAVDGWLGPSGAPQDFQNGGQLYEIKACAVGSHQVAINSLEQLNTGATPAHLIVFFVGTSTPDQEGAFTPNSLVRSVRDTLADSPAASSFELKLAGLGFDEQQPECDSPLVVENTRAFALVHSFPRLIPGSVPAAISSATYCLDLYRCADFEEPVREVLRGEP